MPQSSTFTPFGHTSSPEWTPVVGRRRDQPWSQPPSVLVERSTEHSLWPPSPAQPAPLHDTQGPVSFDPERGRDEQRHSRIRKEAPPTLSSQSLAYRHRTLSSSPRAISPQSPYSAPPMQPQTPVSRSLTYTSSPVPTSADAGRVDWSRTRTPSVSAERSSMSPLRPPYLAQRLPCQDNQKPVPSDPDRGRDSHREPKRAIERRTLSARPSTRYQQSVPSGGEPAIASASPKNRDPPRPQSVPPPLARPTNYTTIRDGVGDLVGDGIFQEDAYVTCSLANQPSCRHQGNGPGEDSVANMKKECHLMLLESCNRPRQRWDRPGTTQDNSD